MRKRGFIIKRMGEDGACLFRAVSDQIYGDQEMHSMVRKHCMDYIVSQHYALYLLKRVSMFNRLLNTPGRKW